MLFAPPRCRPLPLDSAISFPPSPDQISRVRSYARFLFDLHDVDWATSHPDAFAILMKGLCAPPPPPWQLKAFNGSAIYYNPVTRTSSDEHPSDADVRSRCLALVLPPTAGPSHAIAPRRGVRFAAAAILLLLLAAAAHVAFSLLLRAANSIDCEGSWGMQLQQALALVGPCSACIAVGSSYYSGGPGVMSSNPTTVNFTKAAQWFARALRRGCPHALHPLALSLYNSAPPITTSSSPVEEKEKRVEKGHACHVMTECADAGHLDCVALLADMLYRGTRGCRQDFAAGGQRAVAAGQGGNVNGACALASMIADGRAFTRRPEEALKWARVCYLHGGGDSAAAAIQHLRQEVSPEMDEEAKAFASQWRKQRQVDFYD